MNHIANQQAFQIVANVKITATDESTGKVVQEVEGHNLVVDSGLNVLRDAIVGLNAVVGTGVPYDINTTFDYIAVGTGSTAVSAAQTALVAEVSRHLVTDYDTTTSKVAVITLYLPTTAANGVGLREVGLFNDGSGGSMFARFVHSIINKTASISVTYEWTISLAAV